MTRTVNESPWKLGLLSNNNGRMIMEECEEKNP